MASQGCLETDPAGHRTGRLFADIDPAELLDSLSEVAVTYNLSAGQAAIDHVMMPHSSTPNRSEHWRRVLIFRCLDADRELGPGTYHAAVLGEGQLAAWKESLGADTAKWWRGHLRALRQNDAAGAKRADSGWGSVERAAVGAAWRIPIPAQVRGMVVGTLEVEWPPRHDSERAATSGPDTGATAAAASSCAPAPDPTS